MAKCQFEFYVLNYNHNKQKVEMFNIFNNIRVQECTEKLVKKYVRSPKKFESKPFNKGEKTLYGFEAFVKELAITIAWQEHGRREYEISTGDAFITEIRDVVEEIEKGNLKDDNIYDELKKLEQRNAKLEKWDCYMQAKPNMEVIAREVIYQYKKYLKKGKS